MRRRRSLSPGVEDNGTADGPQPYKVILGKSNQAADSRVRRSAKGRPDVSVINNDDDTPRHLDHAYCGG